MVANGKTWHVSIHELNGETSVYRRVSGGCRRNEGAGVVGSGTGVGRCWACVGARGLDAIEGFLALRDIAGDGESVENERKEDESPGMPLASDHGGGRERSR